VVVLLSVSQYPCISYRVIEIKSLPVRSGGPSGFSIEELMENTKRVLGNNNFEYYLREKG
jgi:hypothetical protein